MEMVLDSLLIHGDAQALVSFPSFHEQYLVTDDSVGCLVGDERLSQHGFSILASLTGLAFDHGHLMALAEDPHGPRRT
jgi:hypothetical protein